MSLSIQGATNPYVAAVSGSSNVQPASSPFANLDLTSAQQTQIQSIVQSGQSQGLSFSQVQNQIRGVLSPSQQQTFDTDLQSVKHSGHHHHRGGSDGSSATADVLSPSFGQTDDDESTSTASAPTVNGLTVSDLQNQVLAAQAINQSQMQNSLLQLGSAGT